MHFGLTTGKAQDFRLIRGYDQVDYLRILRFSFRRLLECLTSRKYFDILQNGPRQDAVMAVIGIAAGDDYVDAHTWHDKTRQTDYLVNF